jgi:hypothetical protein
VARVDLSDYGYVNARVRGMRSYLLMKDFFVRLVETPDFEAMHSMLEQTVYRRELNEAILVPEPDRIVQEDTGRHRRRRAQADGRADVALRRFQHQDRVQG